MTWAGDPRTSTPAWRKLRRYVLRRDRGRCHICGKAGATIVDHKVPRYLGGTDDPSNLGAIHDDPCHRAKTAAEGVAARAAKAATRWRPTERHPGTIDPSTTADGGGVPPSAVKKGHVGDGKAPSACSISAFYIFEH